jgi:amino acid transporter
MDSPPTSTKVRVVIASTVMLSFISFWRAAAIVLNDLGSSAYYAGGLAEEYVGKSAPWFILAVMLFSYAVRMLYIESSSMFVRGGVYRVVKAAMGGTLAKLSVSALIFDFILTGPISGVSAGQYIVGLVASSLTYMGLPWQPSDATANYIAGAIAILVTLYFWRRNIRGVHESSEDALKIMYVTSVMVVIMILWGLITLIEKGGQLPPLPLPENLNFSREPESALGWLEGLRWFVPDDHRFRISENAPSLIGFIGIMVAMGHSVLAMSGEETLAQVNRELEHPKLKNLKRAGLVIFIYSLLFTSLVSFFAVAIIPDAERPLYLKNLISGLALNFYGPWYLRLLFQAFVVVVGFLMLSGAVNTAIIGSNGVLNRVSEDGVLTDWFRAPHKKFGTSYRIIHLIAILQIITIVASRGDTFVLGEAYAFGVVWSFSFNAVATMVLRFKHPEGREFRVPGNIRIGRFEIPFGVGVIAMTLLFLAVTNLFTKRVATISGLAFTLVFFAIFTISERISRRRHDISVAALDQFNLQHSESVDLQAVGAKPGNVLVCVRDYNTLGHLERTLDRTNTEEKDVVVLTIRLIAPGGGRLESYDTQLFTDYEQRLFTKVVTQAEKHGKPVDLLVVPADNVFDAVVQTAVRLDSSEIVAGLSSKMAAREQARQLGRAWERLAGKSRRRVVFRVIGPDSKDHVVSLGAHPPQLTEDDINLIHKIWLQISNVSTRRHVHHRDVVRVALERLDRDLRSQPDVMLDFHKLDQKQQRETSEKPSGTGGKKSG